MVWLQNTNFCHGCRVEFHHPPVIVGCFIYCCEDCANGEMCACTQTFDEKEITDSSVEDSWDAAAWWRWPWWSRR